VGHASAKGELPIIKAYRYPQATIYRISSHTLIVVGTENGVRSLTSTTPFFAALAKAVALSAGLTVGYSSLKVRRKETPCLLRASPRVKRTH
jgi:hypothetical protein